MVQVCVTEGILEGEIIDNEYGGKFYSFKGIPYAQPPIGDLRFKAPQPPKPWTGVRPAKEFGSQSVQLDNITKLGTLGSEDCLTLNVYTPQIKSDKPLPVMFWIHGGGFSTGYGNDDLYGPEFLVRQGVIVVTINYRLAVLGFLCLDTKEIPGNAGMKDQVAALRWVKKNIMNFGGDPNNITIFGESAGGTCVNYHLVSPMTKGLFQRAIVQSGAATCWWGKTFNPRERALVIARKLGCFSENDKELYEFFKSQPADAITGIEAPLSFTEITRKGFSLYFGIVSENRFDEDEIYFTGDITDYLPNGIHEGVDIVIGYLENEGLIQCAFADVPSMVEQGNTFTTYFTPEIFRQKAPLDKQIEIGRKIKQFYLGNNLKADWNGINRFHSAELVSYGVIKLAKLCAGASNKAYLYKFTVRDNRNFTAKMMGVNIDELVPCHLDELAYLFNGRLIKEKVEIGSKTFKIVENMTKLWTDFAKHGNPTPDSKLGVEWKEYTVKNQEYLNIGNELETGTAPDNEEITFWDNIFKEYAQYC